MAINRINWLSVLQGWSMLLVVIGHVTLTNVFQDPETPVSAEIERIIYSFHMPLFMFISGFLFYLTKIGRNKRYVETIGDKAKRLLIPYAAFTCATFFLKYAFNPLMRRPVDFSWSEILDIVTFRSNPLAEMWFISTLFVLFLFFPIYKWSLGGKMKSVLMFCAALLIYFFFPKDIELFCISYASSYLLFFYTGILISKYGGGEILGQSRAPLVLHGIDGSLFTVSRHSAIEYFRRDIFLIDPLHVFITTLTRPFRKLQGVYVPDFPDGDILPDSNPVHLCQTRNRMPLLASVYREHPAGFVYAGTDLQSHPENRQQGAGQMLRVIKPIGVFSRPDYLVQLRFPNP